MLITYLINAIVGAFIGLITNYLAIKMLFKPDKPVYIGKFRVPLTPGIIPKEKVRLAKSVGEVVGNKLLTGDVLEKALKGEEISLAMDKLVNDTVAGIKRSEATIRGALSLVIKDSEKIDGTVCGALGSCLKTAVRNEEAKSVVKDLLKKMSTELMATPVNSFENEFRLSHWADKGVGFILGLIQNEGFLEKLEQQLTYWIEKETNNTSPLSAYLPEQFFVSLKSAVNDNSDRIGEIITEFLGSPQIEQNVLEILDGLMDASVTTRIINVFVSKDNIYKLIKQKIEKFLKSEKGKQELSNAINQYIDKLKTTSVGEIVKHANRQDTYNLIGSTIRLIMKNSLDSGFSETLSNQIKKYISGNSDMTIGKLIEPFAKEDETFEKLVDKTVEHIIQNHADKWVDEIVRIAVPRLLDQKISFFVGLFDNYGKSLGTTVTQLLFSFIVPRAGQIINTLNIPKLIADKVNEYDTTELEEIILSIIDRELKAVIYLGALFGFIIGLAGPLLSKFLT